MESVGKSPECVEYRLGEILAARTATIANTEDVPGVGPPDLCWIQRTAKGLFNKKKPKQTGYYHWVVGLSVTSSASVAAYFARLTASKKVGYCQGMGVGREFAIERGIYCCYDPFTNMDIWVEMVLPGGAISRGLDRDGYLHDVTADMWRGAHVGSFLRTELYDPSVTLHCSRAFHHMPMLKSPEEECEILEDVIALYRCQSVQSIGDRLHWDRGQGTQPIHMDILCTTLLEHFRKRRRWQPALQFFTELQDVYPSSAVFQAEVYRELDNREGAANLIRSAIQELNKDDHPMMVLACGVIYMENEQWTKAAQVAESVLESHPQSRPGWLLLSRALLCQGLYDKCLRALHLMPPPLIVSDRRALLFRVLPPRPRVITRRLFSYHPEATEIQTVFDESQKQGVLMHIVPGQVLVPRVQQHGADWGYISCTQNVMRAVYDILLDLVQATGWQSFCEIRAKVFILPSDEEAPTEEKQHRQQISLELTVRPNASPNEKAVIVTWIIRESIPWEKPKRKKTSVFARSFSVGATETEQEAGDLPSSNSTELATKVLKRGLGQITKKVIRLPSPSTIQRKNTEQTMSPPSFTISEPTTESMEAQSPPIPSDPEEATSPTPRENQDPSVEGEPQIEEPPEVDPDSDPHSDPIEDNGGGSLKTRVEVVTSAHRLPSDDEVPDAPDNALPAPSCLMSSQGPPSSVAASQDRWQVKIVSMGIQDRVKYFDSMAKEKISKQSIFPSSDAFGHDSAVAVMRPRRSRYSISQTIMETLIHDIPLPDPPMEQTNTTGGSVEPEESGGSEATMQVTDVMDWGAFALDEASRVPNNRPKGHISLFDGFGSGVCSEILSNGQHSAIYEDIPYECTEWLDELILALWEDLATYTEFKQFDRRLKSKNMQTHAESILGTIEWNTDSSDGEETRTPTAQLQLPDSRPVDWMRRGLLCERLKKWADAEQAHRVCIFLSFNLTSLLALGRIYSGWGYLKGFMLMANRIAQFHQKKGSPKKDARLPEGFIRNMSQLLESVGIKDLKMAVQDGHPLMKQALEDVLKWRAAMSTRPSITQ